MARNLGGSFGIPLANMEVARRSQFHHTGLAEALVPAAGSLLALLADMDVFWVSPIFALCVIPLVLLLLKRSEPGPRFCSAPVTRCVAAGTR